MQHVRKRDIDGMLDTPMGCNWPTWRKKVVTRAMRMKGPFTVETKEGPLTCEDGYLALDSAGWPYPISAADFEQMYEPAHSTDAHRALERIGRMSTPDGLYIDGKRVSYKGRIDLRIDEPARLIPPVALADGSTAEAWKQGRLVARFVSRRGVAVDPAEMLSDVAAKSRIQPLPEDS